MSGLLTFVVSRLLRLVLTLFAVSLITFVLLQAAPGNFADISRITSGATGIGSSGSSEAVASLESRYGDDVPVWKQYLIFIKGATHASFGPSYKYPNQTVQEILGNAFPISATLAVLAVLLALLVAVPLGVIAAVRRGSFWDSGTIFGITLSHSVPNYLLAIIMVLVFSVGLHWFPTRGWDGPENLVLPVLALAAGPMAVLARYVRSSMLETLREEYIVAARAKGGAERTVIIKHALRNSLIPLVTVVGPLLATLMTGTVFIETVFGIPGLGLYFTGAAMSRDMPLLMGTTLFFALILILTNLTVDLIYGLLDPRIRAQEGRAAWSRKR